MSEHLILYRTWDLSIHFDGEDKPRVWELDRPNDITKTAYAKHLSRLAMAGINMNRDLLDNATHTKLVDGWRDGFPLGKYNWLSPFFCDTTVDQANRRALLHCWIQQAEAKAKVPDGRQTTREQIEAAWDIVTGEDEVEMADGTKVKVKRTVADDAWAIMLEMLNEKNPTQPQRGVAARS